MSSLYDTLIFFKQSYWRLLLVPFNQQFPECPPEEIPRQFTDEKHHHQAAKKNDAGQVGEDASRMNLDE